MRITGGKVKGHNIEVPHISDLRPSQDIVREAIFNILGDVEGILVLDMYAGTGALGLEALSRGAKFCDFVDKAKQACKTIKQNFISMGFQGGADIYCEEAENFVLHDHPQPYDLIFMDPPYIARPRSVIRALPKLLADSGQIIYLHAKRIVLTEPPDREWIQDKLKVIDTRKYGATHVTFMSRKI